MWVRTVFAAAAVFATATAPALAQKAEANPTGTIYACAAVAEDAARLACFDDAVSALRTKEEAGLVKTIDVAQIEKIEKEAFGFSMPSLPGLFDRAASSAGKQAEREDIEEIVVAVKSARIQGVTGRVIIVLENGQTWEQTDTSKIRSTTLRKVKEARVRKAALGSFMMTLDGGRSFRVRRTA